MVTRNQPESSQLDSLRLDKWLYSARFFKTRQIAVTAIKTGNVKVNGHNAKPSRSIRIGDNLRIDKKGLVFEINVESLSAQRLSAPLAANLYTETAQSIKNREKVREIRRLDRLARVQAPQQKPDKRSRRNRVKFKRGEINQ